ncbi:hypothetical protein HA402_001321 [Bradysia odoriphaga]|nr:hypothetical protein HA402_001321 [Bradysia odoriphaga]
MNLKILVVVGLLIPAITALKYTNESRQSIDNVYNQCWDVVKDYPAPTFEIANNLMKSFEVYTLRLEDLATYENSTILSSSAAKMLHTLGLLEPLKDSPRNLLVQFEKVLPKISFGLRQIVSMQQSNIGRLTDTINDDIKCLERSVMRILNDFLRNGIGNLALGTKSTIAAIVHSERNNIPSTLNSCLDSVDASIVHLTKTIRSINEICTVTLRTLLENLVSFNDFLNATLKSVFGLSAGAILTAHKVTQGLSFSVSGIDFLQMLKLNKYV